LEDLDFFLKRPDPGFRWQKYPQAVGRDCAQEEIELDLQDKSAEDAAVQKALLKTDSVGKVLLLALPFERPNPRKIRLKLPDQLYHFSRCRRHHNPNPLCGLRNQDARSFVPAIRQRPGLV
jgi:hypothetical protein